MLPVAISEIESDLLSAMREAGLAPASPFNFQADSNIHRYRIDGDKAGSKNGSYCVFADDHPAGWFMSWKNDSSRIIWKYGGEHISETERAQMTKRYEEARARREKEQALQASKAADLAGQIWAKCSKDVKEDNLYLKKKRVRPVAIRELLEDIPMESSEGKPFTIRAGTLVVPLWSFSRKIVSLQFICQDGGKFFLPHGRARRGWFCTIGDLKKPGLSLCICEGWATGATVHEISGLPVVCAMNAGNLWNIAKGMRNLYPDREIIITADNDHGTENNPGLTKAQEAASRFSCIVVEPDFADDDKGTDWNDIRVSQGKVKATKMFDMKISESRFERSLTEVDPGEDAVIDEDDDVGLVERTIYSDVYNARLLVKLHGKDLRFCNAWKEQGWLVWNGKSWQERVGHMVTRRAIDTVESLLKKLETFQDDKERDELEKFIKRSLSAGGINSMKRIAQDLPGVPVQVEEFDANPFLLNSLSGVIDLEKKKITPHRREDLLTKIAPVKFDPDAKCPTWDKFLISITAGSEGLITYLQRAVGYSLTGSTKEHCLFVLYGTGRNGKSTFLGTIKDMLGGYAKQAAADAFMAKRNGNTGPSDEIAALRGARFVTAIETDEGQRLAEALVKQLTGGDSVMVRRLYENFFEYKPEFKLFLATNHKPRIRGTDPAIWRRIRLVPFEVSISETEADLDLPEKLSKELPGIFAWAIRGAYDWAEHGLGMPNEIKVATQEYRSEMDIVGRFIEECCTTAELARVSSKDLYKSFGDWCEESGERKMTKNALGRRLTEKGFSKEKGSMGRRLWLGLGLRVDENVFR